MRKIRTLHKRREGRTTIRCSPDSPGNLRNCCDGVLNLGNQCPQKHIHGEVHNLTVGILDGIFRTTIRLLVFGFMVVLVSVAPVCGQGRIDPTLPTAPLTHTRTLGLFPGVDTVKDPDAVLPPLTTKQKYSIFWHRTFDFSLPVEALMLAGPSQATGYNPNYGSGPGPFAERFGSYAGSIASGIFFSDAFLPSMLHQDPRYFRKGRGSIKSRLFYAVKSEFVTRSDSGTPAFNTSSVLGFGMSTALTNAWYPRSSVTFDSTIQRFAIKLAFSATLNIIREFGGTRAKLPTDPDSPVE